MERKDAEDIISFIDVGFRQGILRGAQPELRLIFGIILHTSQEDYLGINGGGFGSWREEEVEKGTDWGEVHYSGVHMYSTYFVARHADSFPEKFLQLGLSFLQPNWHCHFISCFCSINSTHFLVAIKMQLCSSLRQPHLFSCLTGMCLCNLVFTSRGALTDCSHIGEVPNPN